MTDNEFIRRNQLAARFARVPDRGHFTLAETDFGTGIDFLLVWQLWQQSNSNPHACLHVIAAVPGFSSENALARASEIQPELAPLAAELIEKYPPPVAGIHRLVLDHGRVRLTLCLGDITSVWKNLPFTADAWFVHGPGSDSDPRTQGVIQAHSQPANVGDGQASQENRPPEHIAVIGAGIAGCLVANNLAGRGFTVTLVDQADRVAAEASGNRQGALYVKLGVDFNDQTDLALSALLFSQRYYRRFKGNGWHPTGLIQLAYSDAEADRQARFLAKNRYPPAVFEPVSADEASRIAGIPVPHSALWFPASGWLEPARLCSVLSDQPRIRHQMNFPVAALKENPESNHGRWELTSRCGKTLTADRVLICAGANSPQLIPIGGGYRMKAIRGQITEVPEDRINTPSVVVCGPGYINPGFEGSALVGATFDLHDPSPEVTGQSNHENLSMISGLLPEALKQSDIKETEKHVTGRVAFRCTTHDYQPIAGIMKSREGKALEGVYLFTGLGSKGLTYSPLLAEYLGDLISGQPPCLPENLIKRIDTQRCHRPGTGE